MKSKTTAILAILLVLCVVLSACTIVNATEQLLTPSVSVDSEGYATWSTVAHASGYAYKISGGLTTIATENRVKLEKNQYIQVKAYGEGKYADSDFSIPVYFRVLEKSLPTPIVKIDEDGYVTWSIVENAIGYEYRIDGGSIVYTSDLMIRIEEGQRIEVKAVGNYLYNDSEFSAPVYYVIQKTPLSVPTVSIDEDGFTTWSKIENASGYAYKINGGSTITAIAMKIQLEDGDYFQVKAIGKGKFSDSEFSAPAYYVAKVKPKLNTPVVTVDDDGYASWTTIEHATGYEYKINDGAVLTATSDRVKLEYNQHVKVRAIGDDEYAYSDFSVAVYYLKDGPCEIHTDEDNDGECDICFENVIVDLTFLAINDLHGKFMDTENQPGVDELTTYLKQLYQDATREEILLSSGDMWQGTVESSTNRGALMTDWMNAVGFVSMTLGNHEFDWGSSYITKNAQTANFPYLAINVRYNGKPLNGVQSSVVVEKRGVKIGIIGAIGNCLSSISGEFTTGLSFISGDELTKLVKAESTRLREQEGCAFIVYSIHAGTTGVSEGRVDQSAFSDNSGYYYDESLSDGFVNLVFESHTHQAYIVQDSYGVYHIQGGSENKFMSVSNVSINSANGKSTVSATNLSSNVYGDGTKYKSDEVVNEIFNEYFPDENPYETVLGTAYSTIYSNEICNKVAELYYKVGVEKWGGSYNVVLGGGFLSCRNPYRLYEGNITYADLFSILPFDNDIVLGSVSGYTLKTKFINTTNDRYHCYYDTIDTSNISDSQRYYIIVDSYTSSYASNGITEIARYDSGVYARDLLADYLRKNGRW